MVVLSGMIFVDDNTSLCVICVFSLVSIVEVNLLASAMRWVFPFFLFVWGC